MKKIVFLLLLAAGLGIQTLAQITCTNAAYSDLTQYTDDSPNDSIYFICAGQSAELVATPPSGTPGWNFLWDSFSASSNIWTSLATENNVPTSTQLVGNGGYRVKIYDGTNTLVGTYITWVCRITANPTVNVNTIPPGCSSVLLSAVVMNGTITPYYNPPGDTPAQPTLIIDANTSINICFSGTHTWVSDLAFYVVGPPGCNFPTLLLSPNPGANGQGTICNSGDNITNLCFSSESSNNLNVCNPAPSTLSGTYGSYGPSSTPINWSLLYGCDGAQSGWSVQIYDCIGGDVGVLTDATLTFSGLDGQGNPLTMTYSTPPGYSSTILDNSCSAGTASIFTVGFVPIPATPINHLFTYEWTADPPFDIPNSTSSLNITLNPGPTVDTNFSLHLTGANEGAACGGNDTDTEPFDYIEPTTAQITTTDVTYCEQEADIILTSDQAGGTWSGQGITNAANGTFSPVNAGAGTWTINYIASSSCVNGASIDLTVTAQPVVNITALPVLCSSSDPIDLDADYPGGTWSGTGITDGVNGIFDPSVVNEGTVTIDYTVDNECPVSGNTSITIVEQLPLLLEAPQTSLCVSGTSIQITPSVDGGVWSGTGITDTVEGWFDPAVSGTGTWTLTYSYSEVCFDETSIEIEVIDPALSINSVPTLCLSSDPVTLVTSSPGGTWSGPGVSASGIFTPANVGEAGTYTLAYDSENACAATATIDIQVDGIPGLNITMPVEICIDANPFNLTADASGGTWSGDGITNSVTGQFDPAAAGAGAANISYTITGLCTISDNGTIQVNALPNVSAGNNVDICYNENIGLGATGAQSYSWSPAAGLSSASIANPVADPVSTTTYTVTGTSADGCIASDQVTVTVNQEPDVDTNGPLTICSGDSVQLQATGLNTYSWTGSFLSEFAVSNPIAFPGQTTSYTVSGTDGNGCQGTATTIINVIEPDAFFIPSTLEGMSPLTVTFDNQSLGDVFVWDFGNGVTITTNDVSQSPTQTFVEGGNYTVTLTSTLDGCPVTSTIDIYVFFDSALLTIPNIVTLGGDSKNDDFEILSLNIETMDVQIFDRWGKHVGSIDRPNGKWDPIDYGTGIYFYILTATGYDDVNYKRSGSITVIEK